MKCTFRVVTETSTMGSSLHAYILSSIHVPKVMDIIRSTLWTLIITSKRCWYEHVIHETQKKSAKDFFMLAKDVSMKSRYILCWRLLTLTFLNEVKVHPVVFVQDLLLVDNLCIQSPHNRIWDNLPILKLISTWGLASARVGPSQQDLHSKN